ncbi:MAG: OadG family transporter subunit [Clostridiales bacterium]|nr:OadG family transporter subunit [Clostridiales bacterium]
MAGRRSRKKIDKKKKLMRNFREWKKNFKRSGMGLVFVVLALLCVALSLKKIQLIQTKEANEKKIAQLKKEKKELNEDKKELQEYSEYTKTKQYVEDIAREQLGLVYEDEIIFESN